VVLRRVGALAPPLVEELLNPRFSEETTKNIHNLGHQKRYSRPIRGAMAELSCMGIRSTMLMYVLMTQRSTETAKNA